MVYLGPCWCTWTHIGPMNEQHELGTRVLGTQTWGSTRTRGPGTEGTQGGGAGHGSTWTRGPGPGDLRPEPGPGDPHQGIQVLELHGATERKGAVTVQVQLRINILSKFNII